MGKNRERVRFSPRPDRRDRPGEGRTCRTRHAARRDGFQDSLRGEISSCGASWRGARMRARRCGSAPRLLPSCVRFQCVIKSRPWPEPSSPKTSSPRQSNRVAAQVTTFAQPLRSLRPLWQKNAMFRCRIDRLRKWPCRGVEVWKKRGAAATSCGPPARPFRSEIARPA